MKKLYSQNFIFKQITLRRIKILLFSKHCNQSYRMHLLWDNRRWKCIDTFSDRQVCFIKVVKILSYQLRFLCINIVLSDRQYFFSGFSSGRRVKSQCVFKGKGSETGPWHGNRFLFRRDDQDMLIVDFSLVELLTAAAQHVSPRETYLLEKCPLVSSRPREFCASSISLCNKNLRNS